LLAQSKLRTLVASYVLIALSVLSLQALSAGAGGGLLGVWGVYFWFQLSRVALFSWRSGILRLCTPVFRRLYTPAMRSLGMPETRRERTQPAAKAR
jgi:hypothetical protein